jgi:hypothetical protein
MHFNSYSHLKDKHAFLSPSKYHWINYDPEKLARMYVASQQAARGTALHDLADKLIKLEVKLKDNGSTLSRYVNDALGYRMSSEVTLFYSENCFGHADAIGFRRNKLRIHDLKTGVSPTSEHQLEVYAALFCLEYNFKPVEIDIELRIYQNDDVQVFEGDPLIITHIMDRIISFDKLIQKIRMEDTL